MIEPKPATDDVGLHFLAGACTVGLYPVGVLLLASALFTNRDWRRPPKKSPLLAAALIICCLTAMACVLFIFSAPTPKDHLSPVQREELDQQRKIERIGEL